jgi:hypothetical protein
MGRLNHPAKFSSFAVMQRANEGSSHRSTPLILGIGRSFFGRKYGAVASAFF